MGDVGERRCARTRGDTVETTSGGGAKAALLALMVFVAAIAVALAGDSSTAGASELETFASCEELDDWMQSSQGAARTLPTPGLAIEDTAQAAYASGDDSGGAGHQVSHEAPGAAAAPVAGPGVGDPDSP